MSVVKRPRREAWDTEIKEPSQGWRGGYDGLYSSSHGELSQGRLAMRLTVCRNRRLGAALLAAWVMAAGCQRLPYIDQSKPVPHDSLGRVALEDKNVKQADLLSTTVSSPLAQAGQAENDQRSRGARGLADDVAAGDPDRSGQLGDCARDRLRCSGHSDRRLRADAAQYGCECGRRELAGIGHAPVGVRPGDSRDPDRDGFVDLRHGIHDLASCGATTCSRTTTACKAAR